MNTLYDIIVVKCPNCSNKVPFYTDGKECSNNIYTLQDAPPDVLFAIKDKKKECLQCGITFIIRYDDYWPAGDQEEQYIKLMATWAEVYKDTLPF